MEKKQYKLCLEVLSRLQKEGVLGDLILVGSWCTYFYTEYFSGTPYIDHGTIKTRDLDFLVPHPARLKARSNLAELFKDLGFIVSFKGAQGYIQLDHPDLILEFLVQEKSRRTVKPIELPQWGINATPLPLLNFLASTVITVAMEGITLKLPHPANYALHKLIIAQRRTKEDKAQKDKNIALSVLRGLMRKGESQTISRVFQSAPAGWQKKIIKGLEGEQEILDLLK